MRVTARVFGLGHRRIHRGPASLSVFDVLMARVTAVDDPLLGFLPVTLLDLIEHRRELPKSLPLLHTSTPTMTWLSVVVANWTL